MIVAGGSFYKQKKSYSQFNVKLIITNTYWDTSYGQNIIINKRF